jgi:hypothetical protein
LGVGVSLRMSVTESIFDLLKGAVLVGAGHQRDNSDMNC